MTRKKESFVRHVFRCRLYGPDGRERTKVRKNIVTKTGRATYSFDLALNDATAPWKIVVRDVATGMERSGEFQIGG